MVISHISKSPLPLADAIIGSHIKKELLVLIQQDYPDFNPESYLSIQELNTYRRIYFTRLIEQERGEMQELDKAVLNAVRNNTILSENINEQAEARPTTGDTLADKIASFGGSWAFIITFFTVLITWMLINIWLLGNKGFDPYPFILLNLILSCLAAIQAPIIMMSQNRQEQKDRIRAEHDYKVNLKAELEIQLLSEKIDYLLVHQNRKLLEIQEVQIDYLEDMEKRLFEHLRPEDRNNNV